MATTDEYVKFDIRFFDEFSQYLDFDEQDLITLRKAVEMGLVQRDRLIELAISAVSGIPLDSRQGRDHADGSDTKTVCSSYRCNNIKKGSWMHSWQIRNIASKTGALRVVAYNQLTDKFHYFFIPYAAWKHCKYTVEIILQRVYGAHSDPGFDGETTKASKWWQYECTTFEEMCSKIDYKSVDKQVQFG